MNEEYFMNKIIAEAKKAKKTPYAAAIVKDNKLISIAHNTTKEVCDPTAHAEINAIRIATKKLNNRYLEECTMYCTFELCVMCIAAAWWAKIPKIVYGAKIPEICKKGKRQINIKCETVNKKGGSTITIKGGFLEEDCKRLLSQLD